MTPGSELLVAALAGCAAILAGRRAPALWLALSMVSAVAVVAAAISVLTGGPDWEWRGAFQVGGEAPHLRLDGVSAFFLTLLGVIGAAGAVYARGYWADRGHPRTAPRGRMWWSVLILSMGLVLLSSNGLHFLIAWELLTVSAYFLITLERQKGEVRAAGWLFLVVSHASVLALFAFFSLLAARTGSWDLGPMREDAGLAPLFWLALFGFGLKAGLFPLHIWLPSAHANAPSHVSAIMSGVTIKLGIYGLVRFSGWLPVPPEAGWVVAALGVVSAVLGVAFALGQHDLKRLLAYHSVENIGIILIGLGFALVAAQRGHPDWGRLVLAGGLLHVWNHGLFKALLFFGAGSVLHATGTREISQLGGLWRAMPWTAGLFAVGAAAISGLPPLNGFVSEWLVYLGLFDAVSGRGGTALAAIAAVVLLAMTGALALACFVKAGGVVFLGAPRTPAAQRGRESGPWMLGPMAGLAAACVAIGVAPMFFWPAVARAVSAWHPAGGGGAAPASLALLGSAQFGLVVFAALASALLFWRVRRNGRRRNLTWDCAYVMPTARMQYTAGSFASIITEWFGWILQPRRQEVRVEGLFPAGASFAEHTPETVLEELVWPAGGVVMRLASAARRLQHGRVQAYLAYVLFGVAALAGLAAMGGGS